ncbi:hypothetical protein BDZ91DRAFT_718816 [Kalaharituber pfeilii]|nr:hypothetical protein BDZ91DRAFT_718816 [Kalaharituber pfeilii]
MSSTSRTLPQSYPQLGYDTYHSQLQFSNRYEERSVLNTLIEEDTRMVIDKGGSSVWGTGDGYIASRRSRGYTERYPGNQSLFRSTVGTRGGDSSGEYGCDVGDPGIQRVGTGGVWMSRSVVADTRSRENQGLMLGGAVDEDEDMEKDPFLVVLEQLTKAEIDRPSLLDSPGHTQADMHGGGSGGDHGGQQSQHHQQQHNIYRTLTTAGYPHPVNPYTASESASHHGVGGTTGALDLSTRSASHTGLRYQRQQGNMMPLHDQVASRGPGHSHEIMNKTIHMGLGLNTGGEMGIGNMRMDVGSRAGMEMVMGDMGEFATSLEECGLWMGGVEGDGRGSTGGSDSRS